MADDARGIEGLTLPINTVLRVVVFSLGIGASIWATTGGLRSDVRDILTQLEMQAKLVDERMNTMRETVNDQKRRLELVQYEVSQMREMILKLPQQR